MQQSSSTRIFCRGVHISISSTSIGEEGGAAALFRFFPELTEGVGQSGISMISAPGGTVRFAGAGAGGVAATGVFFVRDLGAAGGAICLAGVGSGAGAAAVGVLGFLVRDLGAEVAGAATLVLDEAAAAGVVLLTLAIVEWETLAVIGESRREDLSFENEGA